MAEGIVSGLRRPNFACVDRDGNVYVTETGELGVLLISPHGDSRRRIGDAAKPVPGQAASSRTAYARIQGGKGIAVDDLPHATGQRRLFVADSVANKVFVVDADSGALLSEFGGYGSKPGMLHHPMGLCITWRNTVLVSERLNRRVQEFTMTGECMRVIAIPGPAPTPSDGYLWGEPRGVTACYRFFRLVIDSCGRFFEFPSSWCLKIQQPASGPC
jgi:sugar lactone lactonase YvrE